MDRQRVLILYIQPLLGEGIQIILRDEPTVEVLGMEPLTPESLDIVAALHPDVVITAEGVYSSQATRLIGQLLQIHAEVPLIRVGLEENRVQIHHSCQLPASVRGLKDALRRLMQTPTSHEQSSTEEIEGDI